jgi:hypothetical protein
MAFEYDVPIDGKIVTVRSDEDLTDDEAFALAYRQSLASSSQTTAQAVDSEEQSWPSALASGLGNLPESTYNLGKGVVEAVASPVETLTTLDKLARGIVQRVLPDALVDALGRDERGDQVYKAVADHYVRTYGSEEGFKNAVAEDPAAILADASTLLTGGGSLAAKMPKMAQVGEAAVAAGKTIEPISASLNLAGKAGAAPAAVLGATTGVGAEPIREAFRAGRAGGKKGETFRANMRGNAQPTEIVDTAKQALATLRQQASESYQRNMAGVSKDATVLDLSDAINALDDSFNKFAAYKGQIKNKSVADALKQVQAKIDQWKSLDPAEFHTPEGLDQLKQSIGETLMNVDPTNRTAYAAVKQVYDSVKSSIAKQAPDYANAMKEYSQSADLLHEMERALSLGNKASADTSLRKLTSLMRNNVNTNYGERLRLGRVLDEAAGGELMPAIAGQTMETLMPRGIQSATQPLAVVQGASTGNIPLAAGVAAASSPRLVGEAAHLMGRAAGATGKAGGSAINRLTAPYRDPAVYNALVQAGLLEERLKEKR